MDKRLKEFKQQIDYLDDSADMEDYHRLIDTLKNMYEDGWLKELEWIKLQRSTVGEIVRHSESKDKENARLREALRRIILEEHQNMEGYDTEIFKLAKDGLDMSEVEVKNLLEGTG